MTMGGGFVLHCMTKYWIATFGYKLAMTEGRGKKVELRLLRRFAPHNDTMGVCGAKKRKMDCHVAPLLAMTE